LRSQDLTLSTSTLKLTLLSTDIDISLLLAVAMGFPITAKAILLITDIHSSITVIGRDIEAAIV